MEQDGNRRDGDSEEKDVVARSPAHLPVDDDTMTTEVVKVEQAADMPFSLPHVSELDEATPRDARSDLVTLPAYGQIASPLPDAGKHPPQEISR